MSNNQDIQLTCFCGSTFTWTAGEQEFMDSLYEQGKIDSIARPKRCAECRAKKKQERERRGY